MVTASNILAVDGDEAIRARVWQRTNENRIRRRQDCRRDADAERGAHYGGDREARCASQRSKTDACVTPNVAPPFGAGAATQHPLVDANGLVAHRACVPE